LRLLSNGFLIAPQRGRPPECPEGYEIYGNPFIFAPKLEECKYRGVKTIEGCCGKGRYTYCLLKEKRITRLTCVECDETVD